MCLLLANTSYPFFIAFFFFVQQIVLDVFGLGFKHFKLFMIIF